MPVEDETTPEDMAPYIPINLRGWHARTIDSPDGNETQVCRRCKEILNESVTLTDLGWLVCNTCGNEIATLARHDAQHKAEAADQTHLETATQAQMIKSNHMRIGLISDTHIPSYGKEPPSQVIEAFQDVDLILHAGDIYIESCIEWLERIAPVEVTTSWFSSNAEAAPRTGSSRVLEIGGYAIGLVHKLELTPMPEDVFPGRIAQDYPDVESLPAELEDFFGKPVDIVVFGYTHEALVETHQGILFVNPGSANMVKQIVKLGTVALLELTPEGPEAKLLELASFGD